MVYGINFYYRLSTIDYRPAYKKWLTFYYLSLKDCSGPVDIHQYPQGDKSHYYG